MPPGKPPTLRKKEPLLWLVILADVKRVKNAAKMNNFWLIIAEAQLKKKIPSDVSETEHTSTHQASGSRAKSKKQLKPTSHVQDEDTKHGQILLLTLYVLINVKKTHSLVAEITWY